jgi:hypothetical protein
MITRCLILLLVLLLPRLSEPAQAVCRAEVQGIQHCVEDRGETHVFVIDLADPYMRVQTVMANDVLAIWPEEEQRERVRDMARRYRRDNVILAVNGDYFGNKRGPEGPTVVNGQRLDTPLTIALNPSRYRRTTLAFSRSGRAAIARLPAIAPSPALYESLIYNAVSGGPLILLNGIALPEDLACFVDRIPVATCRHDRQTAAGVDESGQQLFVAVSTTRSTRGMAELLRELGAHTAVKLDAGGSSQLWYRGRDILSSRRGVANALLIFRETRPRYAAQLLERPPVLLLEQGDRAAFEMRWRNIGHLAWTRTGFYGLRLIGGDLLTDRFMPVPADVPPDEEVVFSLPIDSAQPPGVYESTWQLGTAAENFAPAVALRVVVIPPDVIELRAQVEPLLARAARWNDATFQREWPKLAEQIQQFLDGWRGFPRSGVQSAY